MRSARQRGTSVVFGCRGDGAINCRTTAAHARGLSAQPRAEGCLGIAAKQGRAGSVIARLAQAGALKAVFPRCAGPALAATIVNTAGGITGGDRFDTNVEAGAGSSLSVTTQTAERIYRAQPGEIAMVRNRASVGSGGHLFWWPQETILFDGAALRRDLRIDLARDARLLMVEPLVFGRAAMGETLTDIRFRDRIEITRDGAPLFVDAVRLTGNAATHLARPAVAGGAGAMASLVVVAPEAEAHLPALRSLTAETRGCRGGATLVRDDVLVVRMLATDSYALRQALVPALNRLADDTLPRSWTI